MVSQAVLVAVATALVAALVVLAKDPVSACPALQGSPSPRE